jgi:hypothetical protein
MADPDADPLATPAPPPASLAAPASWAAPTPVAAATLLSHMLEMWDALSNLSRRMDDVEGYLGLQDGAQPVLLDNGFNQSVIRVGQRPSWREQSMLYGLEDQIFSTADAAAVSDTEASIAPELDMVLDMADGATNTAEEQVKAAVPNASGTELVGATSSPGAAADLASTAPTTMPTAPLSEDENEIEGRAEMVRGQKRKAMDKKEVQLKKSKYGASDLLDFEGPVCTFWKRLNVFRTLTKFF